MVTVDQLLKKYEEHPLKHTKDEIGKINLVVVHPFHDQISFKKPKHDNIKRLERLLEILPTTIHKILLENPRQYFEKSAELVEKGVFDKVIFTLPLKGSSFRPKAYEVFKGTVRNYICGCYEFNCVGLAAENINKHSPKETIRILPDCCLLDPKNYGAKTHIFQTATSSDLLLLR